jgi:hypothetical protein
MSLALSACLDEPPTAASSTLEGIGNAFSSAVAAHSPVAIGFFVVVGLVLTVTFLRGRRARAIVEEDLARAEEEREKLHLAAIAELASRKERRQWVRVPASLQLHLAYLDTHQRLHLRDYETLNVGGGGVAFLSHDRFTVGTHLDFKLDIGEGRPLALPGVIGRIEPGPTAEAPSLVVLELRDIDNATRERLIKWVAKEEVREIAEAHLGRRCSLCQRPLADTSLAESHETCGAHADRVPRADGKLGQTIPAPARVARSHAPARDHGAARGDRRTGAQ